MKKAVVTIDCDYSYKRRGEAINHLKDYYGDRNIAHIGTIAYLGVKSGLKDFARVFEIEFDEINQVTSDLDEIMDYTPSYKFKDLDALKDAGERYQDKYQRFIELESKYPNLFRLARKYEGTPRSCGTHASGIVIMPVPVSDVFPTKTDEDGIQTCLFDGVQLDKYGALN